MTNLALPQVLVLGATGPTGRFITGEAVARGYDVTALVRSPEKLRDQRNVKLLTGDARDEKALRDALRGKNAVISALGTPASPFHKVTLLSAATSALVNAMKAEQVSRVVVITGIGAGNSKGHGGFVFDRLIFPLILRHVYADKDRQEDIIRASGLDWTLVRPAILNDKPGGRMVRALTELSTFHGGTISRQDVARFVLDQVNATTWLHQSPLISW